MIGKKFFNTALWFWAVVALYGVILRWYAYEPLVFVKNYNYWLHAHSHAAFLGWLHAGFVVLLSYVLFPKYIKSKAFRLLYTISQFLVAGMLISFPWQGYKAVSIAFLSFFLLGTYVFAFFFWKKNENKNLFPATTKYASVSVLFMLLSSLSPWALGPVMVFLGKDSIWYKLDIYFYLHFQYNGWFFMSLLALIVNLFERKGIRIPAPVVKKSVFWLFNGIFWGYITNALWIKPPLYFNIVALLSVAAEGYGLWLIGKFLWKNLSALQLSRFENRLFQWLLFAVSVKIFLQFLASCPYYANLAYRIRDMVIGYLHWVMLALLSTGLLFTAKMLGIIRMPKRIFVFYWAASLSMIGIIWLRGTFVWMGVSVPSHYALLLLAVTIWTFLSILWIAWHESEKV